jgi:hypothetical protein
MVRLLLEKGANVRARFRNSDDPPEKKPTRTALMVATQGSEIAKLLLAAEHKQQRNEQQPKRNQR